MNIPMRPEIWVAFNYQGHQVKQLFMDQNQSMLDLLKSGILLTKPITNKGSLIRALEYAKAL